MYPSVLVRSLLLTASLGLHGLLLAWPLPPEPQAVQVRPSPAKPTPQRVAVRVTPQASPTGVKPTPRPSPNPEPVSSLPPSPKPVSSREPLPSSLPRPEPLPSALPSPEPMPSPLPSSDSLPSVLPSPEPLPSPLPRPEPLPSVLPSPEPLPSPSPLPSPVVFGGDVFASLEGATTCGMRDGCWQVAGNWRQIVGESGPLMQKLRAQGYSITSHRDEEFMQVYVLEKSSQRRYLYILNSNSPEIADGPRAIAVINEQGNLEQLEVAALAQKTTPPSSS